MFQTMSNVIQIAFHRLKVNIFLNNIWVTFVLYTFAFYSSKTMSTGVSIYCDESSHLENDTSRIMGLGALSCPTDKKDQVFERIREFKVKHGLKRNFEVKWTKVSISKIDFYMDLINYFFDLDFLGFRCIIIDKTILNHDERDSNHDEFYYKMNFLLLREMLHPAKQYKIYLDKKDTNGLKKIDKLHTYLCNKNYDYKKAMVQNVQEVVSDQIELVQLCDLLLGAVCYVNRGLNTSEGKLRIVERIRQRSGYTLLKKTYPSEQKMNILLFQGATNIEVNE